MRSIFGEDGEQFPHEAGFEACCNGYFRTSIRFNTVMTVEEKNEWLKGWDRAYLVRREWEDSHD